MSELNNVLKEISESLQKKIINLLPEPGNSHESLLIQAMLYSLLSTGKRLRPFLTVTSASLFGVSQDSALQTAAALEFIHTYSLIHDDLPALDNDAIRRGQPSCHVKFGEAAAILAGDALLTLAFETLAAHTTHADSMVRCELISTISKAVGYNGMIGGQMLDILSEDHDLSINEIIRMQRMKTGELFAVSCEAGAILGKASKSSRLALRGYAQALGLAFQITDDLLDTDAELTNSGTRKPKSSTKASYVTAIGPKQAQEQAKILVTQAVSHLNIFDKRANLLREFAQFVIERQN